MSGEAISCILCGWQASDIVSRFDRKKKPLVTRLCRGCGLVFNDPIPSDEDLSAFYATHYRLEYKGAFRPRGRQIIRNFRRVGAHIQDFSDLIAPARSVLDIGAGSGEFLFAMAIAEKAALGIEPNREYAAYCREALGLDVRTDALAPDLFEPGRFDFIRLNHVLEHLNDPIASLSMIARFLADDGVLYVEVPNIEIYARSKSVGRMFHYGHIFTFSPWTLQAAAGRAGLSAEQRTAGTTGIFLRKADRTWSADDARNPQNATQVHGLITAHYEGAFRAGRAVKPIGKLIARAEETISSRRLGDPQSIGRAVLAKAGVLELLQ